MPASSGPDQDRAGMKAQALTRRHHVARRAWLVHGFVCPPVARKLGPHLRPPRVVLSLRSLRGAFYRNDPAASSPTADACVPRETGPGLQVKLPSARRGEHRPIHGLSLLSSIDTQHKRPCRWRGGGAGPALILPLFSARRALAQSSTKLWQASDRAK